MYYTDNIKVWINYLVVIVLDVFHFQSVVLVLSNQYDIWNQINLYNLIGIAYTYYAKVGEESHSDLSKAYQGDSLTSLPNSLWWAFFWSTSA